MAELARQLRDLLLTQRRWDAAAELLRRHDADEAADAIVALPFEQQQLLFRNLPPNLAAKLAGHFLYFHAYVLLCSLTTPEIAAIMDAMASTERDQFLDALPEESWRSLMKTLDEGRLVAAPEAKAPVTEPRPVLPVEDLQPILEARQIAKGYKQPEGREIQVVAPMDLSVERIVIWLGVSTVVRSEVSIYTLVDTSRCVHKGHHRYTLTFRPDGSDQTLTFKMQRGSYFRLLKHVYMTL